ncbi:MAG: MoxR family ATPase [Candidatus Eisenbacteria bacterium]|uniref:MoxR family ATPase n=1 Tax=Eiseniibacteriota bacterium TaxID=2212470 RepID=A0A948RT34_UNCEI|nr:MoxR family ATPase [Candidatus Eisenbacteria bacterium]MBU1948301.1 MoxR family ATPase [Candidatus Eisenbacteria bacterium]MBU2690066.1 MoxR family ATPase [Candidatus Eisenbacteria bacterium]
MSSESATEAIAAMEELTSARARILKELRKVIVGQDQVIDEMLIALFSDGHVLLVGVPGLAKTLLISTLAQVLDLKFNRIQFTPDLMPSDITGTEVLEEDRTTGQRVFKFIKGPVFANLLLADEINRTPPKTQAALLQAMQEKEVTASGQTFPLEPPFFVLATQNPIELEGTYPLPEAQLDRFMFNIFVDYPEEAQEVEIVSSTTGDNEPDIHRVLTGNDIVRLQKVIRRVPVSDYVVRYAVQLARATRPKATSLQFVKDWVSWGAGPRCSQFLIFGAKTRAVLLGKDTPSCEDVRKLALPVLRHRIITNFNAEAEGITVTDIIDRIIKEVPEPAGK